MSIFKNYHQQLYSSDNPLIAEDDWFLEMASKIKISLEHKRFLDEAIEIKEIVDTIDRLRPNKAPDLDGLSAHCYKLGVFDY